MIALNKSAKLYGKLERAVALYKSGKSINNIAQIFKMDSAGVYRAFLKAGIKFRTMSEANRLAVQNGNRKYARGQQHASWKGGKIIHENGYVLIKMPEHHRAHKYTKYVFEHIVVIEKKIGRSLKEDECIHHLNGVKADNRPDNLIVMTKSEHMSLHSTGRRHGIKT